MIVYFIPKGRLGNAIFRYLACAIFCIKHNASYNITTSYGFIQFDDDHFKTWMNNDIQGVCNNIEIPHLLFSGFYQHAEIYKKYRSELISYIRYNPDHYILTDGILAGDGQLQQFFVKDLLYKDNVNIYHTVIHIRLSDHVDLQWYIKVEYILLLLNKISLSQNSCIVIQDCKTDFEREYLQKLVDFIFNKYGFTIKIESNDVLTDFHIMKNAEVLISSTSTISWAAAFFSDTVKKCYFPDYSSTIYPDSTCKYPIDNTELYFIGQ
jgi:hypothetical protein